jgi:hypothetical protein
MKNKVLKIISRPILPIVSALAFVFLKVTHALAQGFDPNTMVVYASPEVFACGDNNLCLFFYRNIRIVIAVAVVVLLALIFAIVKFILKIIRKKRQKQNIRQQKPTDEAPKQ